MKKVLVSFILDRDNHIEIYFPDTEKKFNYYYEPQENLNRFDEIHATLYLDSKAILLRDGELLDTVERIYNQIKIAKQRLTELPSIISIGSLVYFLNEFSTEENFDQKYKTIDFSNFWVWSTPGGAQTFMYTRLGKIYLEIGYIYKWNHRERKETDLDFITYEEFIKNYKPILVQEITDEMACEWSAQCETLLKQIE